MYQLKPDRLNGQTIYRPVSPDGRAADGIVHPPSLRVERPPIVSAQELVEGALRDLVSVCDEHGDPLVKAQAIMFRKRLAQHQTAWLMRAARNEREIIRAWLMAHGFHTAAEAI